MFELKPYVSVSSLTFYMNTSNFVSEGFSYMPKYLTRISTVNSSISLNSVYTVFIIIYIVIIISISFFFNFAKGFINGFYVSKNFNKIIKYFVFGNSCLV